MCVKCEKSRRIATSEVLHRNLGVMKSQTSMSQTTQYLIGMTTPGAARPRNVHVETLRLVAIVGIAVFHTFLPWFNALAYNVETGVDAVAVSQSGFALFLLGIISLLGTMGNHIFYMISGFYLIPKMADDSRTPGYWKRQYKTTAKRIATVVVSIAFYVGLAAAVDFVWDVQSMGPFSPRWVVGGLEFVWVYIGLLVIAPVVAWLQSRWKVWPFALMTVFLAVEAANCYIAFFAQGDFFREVLDWRKLMSAATYAVGFMLAGFIGSRWEYFARIGRSLAYASVFVAVVAIGSLAITRDAALIGAVSFKSTSIVSLVMAAGALIAALSKKPEEVSPDAESRCAVVLRVLASGILGFYILQSVLGGVWSGITARALGGILDFGTTDVSVSLWGILLFVVLGILLSLVYVLVILVADRFSRQPLLRVLHLK